MRRRPELRGTAAGKRSASRVTPTASSYFVGLPRNAKRAFALCFDTALIVIATWCAFFLRIGEIPRDGYELLTPTLTAIALALPIFVRFGLYRAIFRYTGWPAIVTITRAVALYGAIYLCIFAFYGVVQVPRTIGILQPLLVLLLVASSRILIQQWLTESPRWLNAATPGSRVLIYGAGSAGRICNYRLPWHAPAWIPGRRSQPRWRHRHGASRIRRRRCRSADRTIRHF